MNLAARDPRSRHALALAGACALTLASTLPPLGCACSASEDRALDPASGDRVAIEIVPRVAEELSNARYTVTLSAGGATLWSRSVDADAFGHGRGVASLDGPCDPSPEVQPNLVTLVLEGLEVDGGELPPESWRNPTPIAFPVVCQPETTTLVPFDLPLATGTITANVALGDVSCAASLDCREAFLDQDGPADLTAVLGFACTAGPDAGTALYFTDITVSCDGEPTVVINPALANGLAVESGVVRAAGTYTGRSRGAGPDVCFWNTAIELSLSSVAGTTNPASCRVSARGTVVAGGSGVLPGGATPAKVRHPVIAWDVPLTDEDGALVCDTHPLNGADGFVAVGYTDLVGETFPWRYACGE